MLKIKKRISLKKFEFPEKKSSSYYYSFSEKFEIPFLIDDFLVIGYATKALRSNRTGCILTNHVEDLYIQKIVNNKVGGWVYKVEFYRLDRNIREEFWTVFKSKPEYSFFDKVQYYIAKDILNEYDFHAPDSVTVYLNDNKYYWDMRTKTKIERENKRFEARNRILEVQAEWFKDENLSGVFDAAMSYNIPKETVKEDVLEVIKGKEFELKKINDYLRNATRFESTFIEKSDRDKLEKEIRILKNSI